MDRNKSIEDLFALTDEEAKEILKWLNSTEDKKIKTPLEKLGYKRNQEKENQIKKKYIKKDIILYEIDEHKIPKDKLKYRNRIILITNEGAECYDWLFKENEPLTFEEMKALLEMKEKGEFSKLK